MCDGQDRTEARALHLLRAILQINRFWALWAAETRKQACNFKGHGFKVPHALKLLTPKCQQENAHVAKISFALSCHSGSLTS